MALLQEHVADLAPLFACGVDAGGVVRARVQEDHRAFWQALEGVEEGPKREPDRLGVVVGVREGINAYVPEDGKVVDWT